MMRFIVILVLSGILLSFGEVSSGTTEPPQIGWSGQVIGVSSGDTITVMHDNIREEIKLFGIDVPERPQNYAKQSKQLTLSLVLREIVRVVSVKQLNFRQSIGIVFLEGDSINKRLLEAGLAWVDKETCEWPICKEWELMEKEAREQRKGVWSVMSSAPTSKTGKKK